jgi:putative SOS response-associated peptidase YedK
MRGRYTQTNNDRTELERRFGVVIGRAMRPALERFNVAPTQEVLAVVRSKAGEKEAHLLRWGLLPSWAKDKHYGFRTINAKMETLKQRPTYRGLIPEARHRCLIPADGFYEWAKPEDPRGKRTPFRFTVDGGELFALAGLWTWSRIEDQWIASCTLLTCPPNAVVRRVHDRMPVILPGPDEEAAWLSPEIDADDALALCGPFPAERMQGAPANPLLNKVGAVPESAELLRDPSGERSALAPK